MGQQVEEAGKTVRGVTERLRDTSCSSALDYCWIGFHLVAPGSKSFPRA